MTAAHQKLRSVVEGAVNGHSNGNGTPAQLAVSFDEKNKLALPPAFDPPNTTGHCRWLSVVYQLDQAHPIVGGKWYGKRGAQGHAVLERLDAPPIGFEPAASINTPARHEEALSWQLLPTDGPPYGFKKEHTSQIAHVIRMLCRQTQVLSETEETAGIVGAFLQTATSVEGHTVYGTTSQRYAAADALRTPIDEQTGRPIGQPRYLIDANTGEFVIRVGDLVPVARARYGGSVPHGWLDGRIGALGWTRVQVQGFAIPGRDGRKGPHLRTDVYRGLLAVTDDDESVNT